jgi:hypothetical protein
MPVVRVRQVRVVVQERCVTMRMGVWLAHRLRVSVPVVLVMNVRMIVLDGRVHVLVGVPRLQHGCEPSCHQRAGDDVAQAEALSQERNGDERADERGGGEEGGLAGRADPAGRDEVERDACAVADGADGECAQ